MIQKLICADTKHHTYICTYIISKNVYKMCVLCADGWERQRWALFTSWYKTTEKCSSLRRFFFATRRSLVWKVDILSGRRKSLILKSIHVFSGCYSMLPLHGMYVWDGKRAPFAARSPFNTHQSVYFAWFYCGSTLSFCIEVEGDGSHSSMAAAAEADSRLTKT